ncbi:dihydrolipoyl dehydrogenase [Halobacillus andaensis]|uniref:Dihydrolipoyl dehydrogenase n=1 Tax=Halobacillus andaensis TaxID=1176239 RepID=A0A917AZK0_HALAA|nr:dihydrolipoyl dehydrogenase [Halobacillus andaensis]MBP2003158.1 dihydrolipoamide dehydrogenase [Halobacillus andaensis]GGF08490.1 dihydrolipoyl dehydrogenase [Halobacillus andaensis]
MAEEYDLVVLGGGTGGYVAAIRASKLGLKVAVVEKREMGGTCLHRGCIPSKALLRSAEVFRQTKEADAFGIETSTPTLNFLKVQERKQSIVDTLHKGVQGLMKKGKIDVYEGFGRILGPSIFSPSAGTISVELNNGEENDMLIPKNVLIATGSSPKTLPGLEIDGKYVMTSDEALNMEELPNSVIIVGGGVIGIEWASMLADFGVEVTVLEYLPHILPTEDEDVSKEMLKQLKQKGVTFVTDIKVLPESLKVEGQVAIQGEVNGETKTYEAERMLVSVGRSANVTNIGLENTDIEVDRGVILTNKYYQTKESHIYAIGDVIGGMQLAHVASHEGITAVEHMADKHPHVMNYDQVPTCIYSSPEAASVGITEKQAKDEGYNIKVGKFPFKAIGKALVFGETDGFVKIIANKENDDLLGVHMVGPHVTDMISEAGLAKVLDATPWEIAESIHPHPTLSEAIGEAAMAVDGNQIHG